MHLLSSQGRVLAVDMQDHGVKAVRDCPTALTPAAGRLRLTGISTSSCCTAARVSRRRASGVNGGAGEAGLPSFIRRPGHAGRRCRLSYRNLLYRHGACSGVLLEAQSTPLLNRRKTNCHASWLYPETKGYHAGQTGGPSDH